MESLDCGDKWLTEKNKYQAQLVMSLFKGFANSPLENTKCIKTFHATL